MSTIKYGRGVLREVGEDAKRLKMTRAAVFTDKGQRSLPHLQAVVDSLKKHGIDHEVFDEVKVEPNLQSIEHAIAYAKVPLLFVFFLCMCVFIRVNHAFFPLSLLRHCSRLSPHAH